MVPRVGGLVAYVRLSFGRPVAFLVGWSMLLLTWPASLASVAVAIGELLTGGAEALGSGDSTGAVRGVAAGVIAVIGGLNLIGLRFGARFEVVLFVLKVTLLAGICIAAAIAAPVRAEEVASTVFPGTPGLLFAALGGAMVAVLWTYDGYADAVYLAGETRDPGRALPRALLTALVTITGLYLLANATFLYVLGVEGLANSSSRFAALDVSRRAFGDAGGTVLTVIAVVVLFGAVNGYFLTGPRIGRLLAEEGLALPAFGQVGESGAPVLGTCWMIVVSIAFALTNSFNELLEITVPVIAATTILVAMGLLVQRVRAPERARPFRVRWAGVVVGLQVALGVVLLSSFVAANPKALAIDAAGLLVGLLVYVVMQHRKPPPP
ncbi:MAG TPA: APC family permease, partial [Planctomycetota bacterium]|nr:APC family permease [Planctomycetota bacterium]